ncbi:MAG: DUF6893 family small protein [Frankiaceae bacterium]
MRAVGIVATAAGIAVLAGGAVVVVMSLPDIRRYLRIRSM